MYVQNWLCVLLLLTLSQVVVCKSGVPGPNSNKQTAAELRAYQSLQGLFNYYWKSDPLAKQIKFVFVCGQVGGWGKPHAEDQCSCNDHKSCVNCYRWYDAVALETVATYGLYANTSNHSDMAQVTFDHSPYNGDWNATAICTFIDDFSWYGIAYLRVYEWLKVNNLCLQPCSQANFFSLDGRKERIS